MSDIFSSMEEVSVPPQEKTFKFKELPEGWYNTEVISLEKNVSKNSGLMLGLLKLKIIDNDDFDMTLVHRFNFDNYKDVKYTVKKTGETVHTTVRQIAFDIFTDNFLKKIGLSVNKEALMSQLLMGDNIKLMSEKIVGKKIAVKTELSDPWGEHNRRYPNIKAWAVYVPPANKPQNNHDTQLKTDITQPNFIDSLTDTPTFEPTDEIPF